MSCSRSHFVAALSQIAQSKIGIVVQKFRVPIQIDDWYLVDAFPFDAERFDAWQEEQQIKRNVIFIAQRQCEHLFVQNGIDHSLQAFNVRVDGLIE
jgi:hypothetical protein